MSRKQKLRQNQNENTKETKISVGEFFKKYSEIIKIVAGILVALYPIANYIYEFIYQVKCEEFYGIPGIYFSTSINSRLLYLGLIVLLIILFLLPSFLRNYEKSQGKTTATSFLYYIFLSVVLGLEMGLINLQNLIEIMQVTDKQNIIFTYCNNWINNHAYLVAFIIIIMGSFSLLGIVLVTEIKNKWIKRIISLISIISLVISGMLILYGTIFKLGTSIEDKTKYEIVTNQNEKYVVLLEEEDKVLVVKYSNEKGEYIFDTNQYLFLNKYDCEFSYVDTLIKPVVNNDKFKNN